MAKLFYRGSLSVDTAIKAANNILERADRELMQGLYKNPRELAEYAIHKGAAFYVDTKRTQLAGIMFLSRFQSPVLQGFYLYEEGIFGFAAGFGRFAVQYINDILITGAYQGAIIGSAFMKDDKIIDNLYRKNGFTKLSTIYIKRS